MTGERSHARDQGRAAERFRAPIDGVDFLRELRCRLQRRVQVAALLDPRHFLARRGGNGLLDADCTSGEKFSCGLRTRQRRESLHDPVVERLVALLELRERCARVRVTAVLVQDQGFQDERLGEEPLLEEGRVQREEVSQGLLVLAATEVRPARLEQGVEPFGRAAADALVQLRGQSVVAALVGEACELQICLVAPLCRGGVAAPDGKLRDREELLRRRGGVSRSERRQGPDLARVALGRIAGRNGTRERARQIELALRFGWKLLLRNSRRSGGRLGSGEAHLRRQLLVERFWTRNQGRLRVRRILQRLEGDSLFRRSDLQRPLEVAAGDRHRHRWRQLAGIAAIRDEELRQGAVRAGPRHKLRARRRPNALGLLRSGSERRQQHRCAPLHSSVVQRLDDRGDAGARVLCGELRPIDITVRAYWIRGRQNEREYQSHPNPRQRPPKSQATPPSMVSLRSISARPRTRPE